MMTIQNALHEADVKLSKHHLPTPRLDAEVLLAFVLQWDRSTLLASPETTLEDLVMSQFRRLIDQRCRRMPVAYLTGTKEFYAHTFAVSPEVLIPRPDTEQLVELAHALLSQHPTRTLADIGTGSGVIAISLAKHFPRLRVYAVDTSASALAVADRNARRHRVKSRIQFLHGSLCEPLPARVDLIVANLPYLRPDPIHDPELMFEPPQALFSDHEGLADNLKLIQQAGGILTPNGTLLLECDPAQTSRLAHRARAVFPTATLEAHADLSGAYRFLQISLTMQALETKAAAQQGPRDRRARSQPKFSQE